jgi:hypothetical protein
MEDHKLERRQDQNDFILVLKEQNELLTEQNATLVKICSFIDPIAAFFSALKTFVVFVAWIAGTVGACWAVWHGFVAWIKAH